MLQTANMYLRKHRDNAISSNTNLRWRRKKNLVFYVIYISFLTWLNIRNGKQVQSMHEIMMHAVKLENKYPFIDNITRRRDMRNSNQRNLPKAYIILEYKNWCYATFKETQLTVKYKEKIPFLHWFVKWCLVSILYRITRKCIMYYTTQT